MRGGNLVKKIYQFDLPFHIYEDSFKELLMVFNRSDYRMMKWILNHLLWEVANHHFNKWLTIANQYAHLQIRPRIDTSYKETEAVIMFIPRRDRLIKYKTYDNPLIVNYCPYEGKMKLDPEEISHLPMRLAMSKGMSEEKKQLKNTCED